MNHENQSAERRSRKGKYAGLAQLLAIMVFIVAGVGVTRYLASFKTSPAPSSGAVEKPSVRVARASPQARRLRFTATGVARARAMADVVPQVGGRVIWVNEQAFAGGAITPDTVLFRIEPNDYTLAVARAAAAVARGALQLELQRASSASAREEWTHLYPRTEPPPLAAEAPQLRHAEAQLQAAHADREAARLNLLRTAYRLPFTGRIASFRLEEGQVAVAGRSYGRAYRRDALEIVVPLDRRAYERFMETPDPEITVRWKDGRKYKAAFRRPASEQDPVTRMFRVTLGLREKPDDLLPGAFVTVDFVGPRRTNVWVFPLDVLQKDGALWTVNDEQRLERRTPRIVQIGRTNFVAESDGTSIRAVRGLLPEATEGTPVHIAEERNAKSHDDRP